MNNIDINLKLQKIAFISLKSLLDVNSGASMELRTVLGGLAATNFSVQSFTFNCYDVGDDYVKDEHIDKRLSPQNGPGQLFHHDHEGIRHYLLVGASKDTMKLTQEDLDRFIEMASNFLTDYMPDHVVFFGSNELLPLLQLAKSKGAKIVFYTGTASYAAERQPLFDLADTLIAPSQYISDLYKNKFGATGTVIPTTLDFEPLKRSKTQRSFLRQHGFITLINPSPDKGGHIFINIANMMKDEGYSFLAVESRGTRKFWKEKGFDVDSVDNLYWAPWQSDIRAPLHKTSLLVMPSLIDEAAGKVISEAMSMGIPCIGYNVGGIKDQIGEGGFTLELPAEIAPHPETQLYETKFAQSLLQPLAQAIKETLADENRYETLAERAFQASQRYTRGRTISQWSRVLEDHQA